MPAKPIDDGLMAVVLVHYGADLTRVATVGWKPVKCPFHPDRTASASVNLNLGGFRCHACDVKGDALKLIMEQEGISYKDAVTFAKEVLGQSVGDLRGPASQQKRRPSRWRDKLFA